MCPGVDTWAHYSCLEAGGRTIAALGTGVDVIYPWKNRQLYNHLLQNGLAVSEFAKGTKPDRAHFPRRNRIIAGLCRAVIVMEAPERSGALITAHLACEYGRDVYVVPGSLDNPKSLGCLALLNQGAQVILGETHLLDLLGSLPQIDAPLANIAPQPNISLSLMQQQIIAALRELSQSGAAVSLDKIVQHTAQPAGLVSAELLQLELLELVTSLPGTLYQCT
jgi:DNA processing protein